MKATPLWLGAVRYEGPCFRLSEARGGPGDPPLAVKLPHLDPSFGEDRESLLDELSLCRSLPEGISLKPRGPAGVDLPGATVWEWVEGQPLSELLGAPMRPASAVRALLCFCGPLGDLHDQQIVLDDLRPEALWLDRVRGTALFLDLSAARFAGPGRGGGKRSLEERRLEILAPEQSGLVALSVDHRADLYALGALFYWMLAGRPPFAAPDRTGLVHAQLTATPEPLVARCPGLPLALSEIAGRLLEKNPGARYQSALGLAADLRECLDQLQIDGEVEPFPLGQRDASPVLRLPRGLFGREDAIAELRAAALDPAVSAVAVAGPSGIGKSSLVAAALAGSGARVATSKLDLVAGRAPLSALREALRPLVDRLLGGDPATLNPWLARLGADDLLAASLVELLPSLSPVLAAQPRRWCCPPWRPAGAFT